VCLQGTDEQKFALQLQQLSAMGFCNRAANVEGMLSCMIVVKMCVVRAELNAFSVTVLLIIYVTSY